MADQKAENPDAMWKATPDAESFNLVVFMSNAWKASDDAWRPRRVWFDESWALFWNRYDFSKKAPWQSKNFSPKMARMVRSAVYAFKSALVGVANYFSVDGVGKQSRERAWVVAKILKYWLDQNNFVHQVVDSIFGALLSSLMVFKIYVESVPCDEVSEPSRPAGGAERLSAALEGEGSPGQPRGVMPGELKTTRKAYSKIRVEIIDPNWIRQDPTGRKKYIIHRYKMDYSDLKELAKVSANKYKKEIVDSISEDFRKMEEEVREKMRRNEMLTAEQHRGWRREVVLDEYWGEIFDTHGNLVGRNMTFTVANEKYLVREPMKNRYHPKKLPFIIGAPMRVAFSNFHQSFAENINGLCRIATEILNLTLDSNLWASIKAFELDLDQVVDPNEFKNGVYPGKVFKKRTRGVPRQMVTPLEMGMVNPQNLQMSGAVEREMQNATGVNEFSAGFVGSRKNETATEINVKGAQSEGYLNSIAGEVEDTLALVLEMIWDLVLIHQDNYDDAELKELLGEDVSDLLVTLTDEGRKEYLGGKYKFIFRGMSSMLEKGKELEKCQMVIQALNKVPGLAERLKDGGIPLARKFFDSLNWNPDEYIITAPGAPPPGTPQAAPPPPPGAMPPQMALAALAGRMMPPLGAVPPGAAPAPAGGAPQ